MISLSQHLCNRLPKAEFLRVVEAFRRGVSKYATLIPVLEECEKLAQQAQDRKHAEVRTEFRMEISNRDLERGRLALERGRSIRLPDSRLVRHAVGYVRLLHHIRPTPSTGADLVGTLLRSGSRTTDEELRPDASWPEEPLLIECAGHMPKPKQFRDRGGWVPMNMYILWRLDWQKRRWVELARCAAAGPEWLHYICPIIERLLTPTPLETQWVNEEQVSSVLCSLLRRLDEELKELGRKGKEVLLSQLYDQVTNRLAEVNNPLASPVECPST